MTRAQGRSSHRSQHARQADAAPARGSFVWQAALIFAIALLVRAIHVRQLQSSPFFDVLLGDSRGYDEWARRIAAGDWIGTEVFYQAPLYPYFLGVIYSTLGRDLLLVRLVQILLGSTACVFVGLAGARLFSRNAGLVAGLMMALYAPAIFFDGLLQKAALDLFLLSAAVWIFSVLLPPSGDSGSRKRFQAWVGLGVVLGLLSLTRENAVMFVAVIAFWALLQGAAARSIVPFTLGLALVLVPVAVRNYAVGGGLYVTTSQFGTNFYLGNNPFTDGTAGSLIAGRGSVEFERQDAMALAERASGRTLTPAEVSSYWTGRAWAFISSEPGRWATLLARKTALLWNTTEMLDTESLESHAEWSTPLRVLGWAGHFGLLVPLAVMGVVLTWPDRARLWPLLAMTVAYAASVVAFFVYARYRYPLVPFLVLFASAGVVHLTRLLPSLRGVAQETGLPRRSAKREGWAIGLAVLAAVLTNQPMLSADRMMAITEHNLGAALQTDGDLARATQHYRRALQIQPDYAPAHNNLGTALMAEGDVASAAASYERALALVPDYANAQYNLANARLQQERPQEALELFRQSLATMPPAADVQNNMGIALAELGRLEEAVAAFEEALRLDPRSAQAHRNLGDVRAWQGRTEEAIAELRLATALDPAHLQTHVRLAGLLLEQKRLPEAAIELRAAVALDPGSAELRNDMGLTLAALGRVDEAISEFQEAIRLRPGFAAALSNLDAARRSKGER